MRCEVVRETLSSLLDGEQQELPAQQVDAHLASCRSCRRWLVGAAAQARKLTEINSDTDGDAGPDLAAQILAAAGVTSVTAESSGGSLWSRWGFRRPALIAVGVLQVAMAAVQIAGVDFGMVSAHGHGHGAATGAHLLHESTAWLLALGGAMIAAGIWPSVAVGVAAIAGVYALALGGYVAVDAYHGQVTAARIASHLPVLIGLVFALLVARQRIGGAGPRPARWDVDGAADGAGPAAPGSRGRRRHLRSVNRSDSSTTMRRNSVATPGLRWMFMAGADRVDDDAVTALAVAAAAGDARALEAFIKATQHDVWRFVAYLFDGVSADDLTQETFLRAIGAIPRFAGRSSARTWLLAIARRVVADHIRYLKSRPRTAPGADPELLLDRDRPARGFEDVVEVTALIAGLSTDQREALLLTQLFGLSYSDAAAVCGCPVGTIRSRVARARDALLADPERGELTG
ncbi:RNA polymerase sigma factor SigC [Mycolicibacter heraklionensis]|uniref:RNA polymerase sigma factor n=2 Tax=Mycolicibacter heraklionensis TaxID=512402 RepID=A0A9X7WKI7_9MYCO|nr:RNA polymerase sigma factor SigC [Mycolicibacter heraklionensis]